jgi:hypothetical protein
LQRKSKFPAKAPGRKIKKGINMDISKEFDRKGEKQTLQIWRCGNCEAVHFQAGKVLLNFTKAEFAELAYSVNDVFQAEFGSLEFYHLISSLNPPDDVLASETIS